MNKKEITKKLFVVIGIEIHVQLNLKQKMFSKARVEDKCVNKNVEIIDLALPGYKPKINLKAVFLAIQAAYLLNLNINKKISFDRKNYLYPDLPKGFQLTQQFHPLGVNGYLEIETKENKQKKILIERLHIEEDTAKQIHSKIKTFLNFDRCGRALIEIVTKPCIENEIEAINYVKKIKNVLKMANISTCEMSKGTMRCDINISLQTNKNQLINNKVEIKNLNSLKDIKEAIIFEIKHQKNILKKNKKVELVTKRYSALKKETILLRKKEEHKDYHFFPEPNLRPFYLSNDFVNNAIKQIPFSYHKIFNKLSNKYCLDNKSIEILIDSNQKLWLFFLECAKINTNYKEMAQRIINELSFILNTCKINLFKSYLKFEQFSQLTNLLISKQIDILNYKKLLKKCLISDFNLEINLKKYIFEKLNDPIKIKALFLEFINNNKEILIDYPTRPNRVLKFFMGLIMKKTKGKIEAILAKNILSEILKQYA